MRAPSWRSREACPVSDLDERTVAYVLDAQRPFDDLRQAIAQVSGWLVLAALHTRDAGGDHPALARADTLVRESIDNVRAMRPTSRARPHHDGLVRAGRALGAAVRDARTSRTVTADEDIERVSAAVKTAYAHLARAAAALPGFEIVSFEHACCNPHVPFTSRHSP